MLALIIAPFFIGLQIFVLYRIIKHIRSYNLKGLSLLEYLFGLILFGGVVCIVVGFLLPTSIYKTYFTKIGFYWLGIILYFFVSLFICLVFRIILWVFKRYDDKRKARHYTLVFVIVFTLSMSLIGIYNGHNLKIKNYEVTIDKKCDVDELNVVLLADLHLGYNLSESNVIDMVNKVNDLNPDVIIIAGDIFDNEYEAISNPDRIGELLASMKSTYGTYACLGNHDIEEKILVGFTFSKSDKCICDDMVCFLKNSNINILYDDYVLIDNIYIYGRPDAHKVNYGLDNRLDVKQVVSKLNNELPIIVIDHEPSELEQLSNNGVDLALCGHTHAGQLWPSTILNKIIWDNGYGFKMYDDMASIVTSGVGLFGPNMRLGTYPEICNINISFKK